MPVLLLGAACMAVASIVVALTTLRLVSGRSSPPQAAATIAPDPIPNPPAEPASPPSAAPAALDPQSGDGAESPVAAVRAEPAAKLLSTADIVAESEASVALIRGKASSGTGFLAGPGLLATNAHVIAGEFIPDLEVRFVSAGPGQNAPLRCELLYEDPARDLAFLAVKTALKPLRVAESYAFRKGEDVTVIGSPGFGDGQVLENAISRGVMSTRMQIDGRDFYQLGIAINPGNSGGPVFDSHGRVIGVATLKAVKQEATGFSIPIEDVQDALGKVGRESPDEAERYQSDHRFKTAMHELARGTALLCITIDLRRARALSNDPSIDQALATLEPIAAGLDREVFPSLATYSPLVKGDPLISPLVRGEFGALATAFGRLRDVYGSRKNIDDRTLRSWKQTARRCLINIASATEITLPPQLMTAFNDHSVGPMPIPMAPGDLSPFGRRLRPRGFATIPGGPDAVPPPPSPRNQVPRRRGSLQ